MNQARSRVKTWVLLVAALAGGVATGCYNPKVTPGRLHCATPPSKLCPDGLTCVAGLCETASSFGGRGGGSGGAGGGGAGGSTCAMPVTSLCETPAGTTGCDPVCQTGCGCGLRCRNLTTTGTACVAPLGRKVIGDICNPESDECSPGQVCLKESCGTNLGRCFRYCREHVTCGPGGVCGTPIQLPGGGASAFKVCNVADQVPTCDAFARTGCLDPAFVCYVAGQNAKCDCPSGLNRAEGQNCMLYNDCAPGLTCLKLGGVSQCHRLCRTNTDCGGAACTFTGSSGFCP